MRTFIGINLSQQTKENLYDLQRVWLHSAEKFRPTLFDNFHITVKFIGKLSLDELDLLIFALEKHLKDFKQFNITIADIGSFRKGSGDIIWAGITDGKEKLIKLHNQILKAIHAANIEVRKQNYTPHITLARNVIFNDRFYDLPLVNTVEQIKTVTVFKSHHIGDKLTYTPLFEINLN